MCNCRMLQTFEYLNHRYPPQADITEIGGPDARPNPLAIRRKPAEDTQKDVVVNVDNTHFSCLTSAYFTGLFLLSRATRM